MKYSSQKGMFLRTICNEKTFYRAYLGVAKKIEKFT
jgi:hypothetical protein